MTRTFRGVSGPRGWGAPWRECRPNAPRPGPGRDTDSPHHQESGDTAAEPVNTGSAHGRGYSGARFTGPSGSKASGARPESKSRLIFESRSMAETCNLQAITVACPDCDLLNQVPELAPGESANCYRCNCRLSRFAPNCLDHVLALNLTAILLYAVACYFPFLSFGKGGIEVETHLITGIVGLAGHCRPGRAGSQIFLRRGGHHHAGSGVFRPARNLGRADRR